MSRCTAQTTKGRQCKQKAVEGFGYCPRHKETNVDLVAEMEAAMAANRAREEKLKKRIEKLEQLLIKRNHKAEADRTALREKQEGEGRVDGRGGGWLVLGLLAVGVGMMWWRRGR